MVSIPLACLSRASIAQLCWVLLKSTIGDDDSHVRADAVTADDALATGGLESATPQTDVSDLPFGNHPPTLPQDQAFLVRVPSDVAQKCAMEAQSIAPNVHDPVHVVLLLAETVSAEHGSLLQYMTTAGRIEGRRRSSSTRGEGVQE